MNIISNKYVLHNLTLKVYNKRYVKKRYIALKANENDECHYENYQVFQHQHITYNDNVNIKDVDDHLEAVHKLKKTDKDDYFMSHGLDYDRCYEYINIVKYLNRCWKVKKKRMDTMKTTDDNKQGKQNSFFVPGWTILGVIAFIYHFVKDDL
jgi:hypothetical protein